MASEYQQTNKLPITTRKDRINILAIFGNSQEIDISQDRTFLETLSIQAEIEFLLEPKLGNLNEQLRRQCWDILFFAGHSCSKEKGLLQINQTDTITLIGAAIEDS